MDNHTHQVPISIAFFHRMKQGDQLAFKQIFDTYYRHLVLFAMRYLSDKDLSESVVQEVFVNLWEKREQLQIHSLQGYLVVAVRNRCQNEIKKKQVMHHYQTKSNFFHDLYQPEAEFPDDHIMQRIYSVIDEMPEQRKRIFKMNRIDGMRYKEIAEALNIAPKTVEIQIGHALKYLREHLKPLKNRVYHEN